LTIIKTTQNYIFGGYTNSFWSTQNVSKPDPKAFIFSLINKHKKPIKINCEPNKSAIQCYSIYGPVFGNSDIFVQLNSLESNMPIVCRSLLGNNYVHPSYKNDSNKSKSFLAGSETFDIVEIEVFQKLK
jgi:hypothetical protein